MLEDIRDGGQSCLRVNRREERYNIHDHIKRCQVECKVVLLSMWNAVKGLHKVFKDVVNDISQALSILGEFDSEVSYFVP